MVNVEEALEEYFKIRGQYKRDLTRRRARIRKSVGLTDKEKRQKLVSLKGKCPGCGKTGGVSFSQNGTFLTLTCSDLDCPLEIRIDRGRYVPLAQLLKDTTSRKDLLTGNIINAKLDMMFGFSTEEETVANFNKFKKEYIATNKKLDTFIAEFKKNNTDDSVLAMLKTAEDSLVSARLASEEVAKEDTHDKAQKMVRILVDDIMPAASEIMKLKYGVNTVIPGATPNMDVLVQKRSSYDDNLVLLRKASVLRYVR